MNKGQQCASVALDGHKCDYTQHARSSCAAHLEAVEQQRQQHVPKGLAMLCPVGSDKHLFLVHAMLLIAKSRSFLNANCSLNVV